MTGQTLHCCFSSRNVFAAVKVVWLHTGTKPKYPVCFLTNGGGVTEAQKAEQLSGWLDVAVGVDQVAQHAGQPLYCPTSKSCRPTSQWRPSTAHAF